MCCITSMIYTTIDTFYVTQEQLENSPSRKDGVDEVTEMNLRIYGCDLIQESGILLRLPQAVMATGQVLFHRFYCKKSLVRFNVKRVAASCVWLASKLEESPRKARHVLIVFHRMECRRENLPIRHLEPSKKYTELKIDLIKMERHLLKEMGFICHVEHPHKFISSYLAVLETPPELRQEAWNLANDSLRTTLCVRYKSEVVACGVVCAAARRLQVALPEDPPWWKAFDAERSWIDEVCLALARLYTLPKARYVAVCKDGGDGFTSPKSWDLHHYPSPKESLPSSGNDNSSPKAEPGASSKEAMVKVAVERVKESEKKKKKTADECGDEYGGASYEVVTRSQAEKRGDRVKHREKDRSKTREDWEDNERDNAKDYRSGHHRSKVRVKDYSEDGHHYQSTKEERRRHHSHV